MLLRLSRNPILMERHGDRRLGVLPGPAARNPNGLVVWRGRSSRHDAVTNTIGTSNSLRMKRPLDAVHVAGDRTSISTDRERRSSRA
jgi:hypothetical protein